MVNLISSKNKINKFNFTKNFNNYLRNNCFPGVRSLSLFPSTSSLNTLPFVSIEWLGKSNKMYESNFVGTNSFVSLAGRLSTIKEPSNVLVNSPVFETK